MWVTDARARVVASMNCLAKAVEAIPVRISDLVDKLRVDLTTLIPGGSRPDCKELIHVVVTDFTAVSVEASAFRRAGPVIAYNAANLRSNTLVHLEDVSAWSVLLPKEAVDAKAVETAVAMLIGNASLSDPSASHAVKDPYFSGKQL